MQGELDEAVGPDAAREPKLVVDDGVPILLPPISIDPPPPLQCALTHTLRPNHSRSISTLCFSPDGKRLSTSSSDGSILLWSITLRPQPEHPPHIECLLRLTPNPTNPSGELDRQYSPASSPGKIKPTNGTAAASSVATTANGINDLTWSPDSRFIVSGSDDHLIRVWSADQRDPIRTLSGHSHCVYCLKLNPVGSLLISGSFDETIKVWDFIGGRLLRTLPGHSEVVSCLDFSRDGSVIVSASFDGLIRLWDTTSGQCLKTLVVAQETNAPVSFVAFTPNPAFLLTATLDSTVRLWDYKTKEGTVVKSYQGHVNIKFSIPARVINLGQTGDQYVLIGSEDGKIYFWDLQSREVALDLITHQDPIIGLAVHPHDSSLIVTANLGKEPVVKVYKLSKKPTIE